MTTSSLAEENVKRLIALTERLTERLAVDAHAFEARRPHEAAARLEETSRLANLYRHESARVKQDPSLIEGAPDALTQQLRRASEAFEAVLARHGRALYAAKTVTEGVVRAIADEVAKGRSANMGYGPGGKPPTGSGSAITLNKRA
jgi:hypothetical protein